MSALPLMLDRTAVGLGSWFGGGDASETNGKRSIQCAGASASGTWTAVLKLYGANDTRFPVLVATFNLSDAAPTDAVEINFKWEFFAAELVSTTGSATKATAVMSV